MRTPVELNPSILEEACSWFIDLNEGINESAREQFNAWLRRSPEHVRAYLEISAFWEYSQPLEKLARADLDAVIARAREQHNVFSLEPARERPASSQHKRGRSPAFWLPLAMSMVIAAAGIAIWHSVQRNIYVTGVGEQRFITLADGSTVGLNSRSRLRVRFSRTDRTIDLLQGQALFHVQKDRTRPFTVISNGTRARAIGTQFDVYRKTSGVIVTVLEGRVAVAPRAAPLPDGDGHAADIPSEVYLSAGQRVTVIPAAPSTAAAQPERAALPTPVSVDLTVATAWTDNKLIFDSTPLREVIEEFNRYNHQQLVIRDPELLAFHVSGVFPSTDSGRIVELLRQRFNVVTRRSGDEIEISLE